MHFSQFCKKLLPKFLFFVGIYLSLFTLIYASPYNTVSVGTAKVKITPDTPIPMSGFGNRNGPFEGIHDDLYIRVLAFDDGENKALIIVADIIGFSNSFYQEISNLIEGETGIPQEYIMLCATHTHSGPVCGVYNQNISPEIRAYVNDLRTKLLGATKMAICNLEPATIGVGKGICKMNINRRGRNVKGEMMLRRNPYGSIDNEVAVVKINGLNGDPMAIFINWPCHGTSIGSRNYLISGDWLGAAARFVEKEFNNKIIAPVTAGASGDINPIYAVNDFNTKIGESEIIGKILGEESIRVLKNLSISPLGTVKGSQRLISLPEKKRGEMNELNYEPTGDDVIIRLSVLKINTIVFVGISGELVHEIGLEIKELSPFKQTIVVTHCNGSSGYFATDKHYTEGGYEVRTSRLMPGAESAIIENLMEMIRQL